MLKKPPSRNQRTKGIRVKHILQIAVLLGVCFWLVYQLKHSYDKKAALAEKDAKTSIGTQTESELLKLGRKDLPHKEVTTNVKQEEEEEEEAVGEEEEKHEVEDQKHEEEEREEEDPKHEVEEIEEEGQNHEAEEQEELENKNEDAEDEGKGAGDDEVDENDLERKEGGADGDEDPVDEEKEREDEGDEKDGDRIENEEREDRAENENSSDDQDNEGGDKNAHEAREEHYKGDDASSAVTHDTQVISTETDKVSSETSNETSETSEVADGNQHNLRLVDGRTAENATLSVAASEEKLEGNASNPVTSSLLDANVKIQSSDLPEADNNSTIVSTEASNNLPEANQATTSYQLNGTETVSEAAHAQNTTVDGMTTREGITGQTLVVEQTNVTVSGNDQSDSNSTVLKSDGTAEGEDRSSMIKETTDSTKNEDASKNVVSKNEDATENVELKNEDATKNVESKNENATKNEESNGSSESGRTDENSESTNGTEDAVQHDPIDSSDSHISEDEKEARTDLDTLPEIQTVGDENGEAAAE